MNRCEWMTDKTLLKRNSFWISTLQGKIDRHVMRLAVRDQREVAITLNLHKNRLFPALHSLFLHTYSVALLWWCLTWWWGRGVGSSLWRVATRSLGVAALLRWVASCLGRVQSSLRGVRSGLWRVSTRLWRVAAGLRWVSRVAHGFKTEKRNISLLVHNILWLLST